MDESDAPPIRFRFATSALPEADRLPVWREEFGKKVVRLDVSMLAGEDRNYLFDFSALALPTLKISLASTSRIIADRTPELIKDGSDDLLLMIARAGRGLFCRSGAWMELEAGDAVLMSNAIATSVVIPEPAQFLIMAAPFKGLAPLIRNAEAVVATRIPAVNDSVRLLASYAQTIFSMREDELGPELAHLAAAHVKDLIALAAGPTSDAAEEAKRRGAPAARLRAIKAAMLRDAGSVRLSIETIARRQGISAVYVRKLFEREGTTFSRHLLEIRLNRAFRLLADPRRAGWTISTIALEAGFGELSTFNRAFRRRFGGTPSDVRAQTAGRKAAEMRP